MCHATYYLSRCIIRLGFLLLSPSSTHSDLVLFGIVFLPFHNDIGFGFVFIFVTFIGHLFLGCAMILESYQIIKDETS